jgi:hypothetical protein
MARRSYYSSIAYAAPERFTGLQLFRNFYYGANNSDFQNVINTGINQTQITTPFGNQEVGQLGNRVCCLNNLPTAGGQNGNAFCKFSRGKLILTNMLWNQDTLETLADGFKKNERYLNGFTTQEAFNSEDYKRYAGVFLDFNQYDDQTSYKKDVRNNIDGSLNYFGSRGNYDQNSSNWLINTQTFAPVIDDTTTEKFPCFGQQRDGSPNSGIELEGLWVQSRWREEFLTMNINGVAKPADGVDYNQLLQELTTGAIYDGNFSLPDPNNANSGLPEMLKNNGTTQEYTGDQLTYDALIEMAREFDIAAIPIWNRADGNVFKEDNPLNRPYIAFISAVNVDDPATILPADYDYQLGVPEEARWDFNKGIEQTWFISKWNAQYGFPIGFDNSFTRNRAVQFSNLQRTIELDPKDESSYAGVGMIGAVNPAIKYDELAGRFEIEGLNSGMTIGNGNLQQPPLELEATDDPEQLCYNVGVIGNIQPYMNPSGTNQPTPPYTPFAPDKYFPCLDMRQLASSIVASQSGVSILDIIVYFPDDDPNDPDAGIGLLASDTDETTTNQIGFYYKDSLFDKMGFEKSQLLPNVGSSQSFFTNNLEFRGTSGTYGAAYQNSLPMTTGQYISSAEIQAASVNSIDMPSYDLGINFFRSARPDVQPASITAFRIPDKLNYPYLNIYSDIATAGADTTYYGGVDSQQKIPCLGFMTRNYNNGDYFYALESTFNYTATKPFVITDITTDIRLPDGRRPVLDPNSAVIYKIQKSKTLPVAVDPSQIKSISNIKEDERRKDNSRRREMLRKVAAQN